MPHVEITDIADPALLKSIWKQLRKRLRTLRLTEFELGHDPLEYLAFDWDLDFAVRNLCRELVNGSYRASAPEIVRGAKGKGLSRPLACLKPRDLLLYKAIVLAAQSALLTSSKPWTRFGRADSDEMDNAAPSGWFRAWLERQNQIWTITENHEWLIETDVANFFPYIHLRSVLGHVLANSNLGEDVVRLLEHMLQQFSPMVEYRRAPAVGLPQENFDCSRVLAHTYLKPIDDEFAEEGEAKQYSRWVDDVVIGVETPSAALSAVHRVEACFERLGLYANTAKTRVMKASEFINDYMKESNDYLGEVEEAHKKGEVVDVFEFGTRLHAHIQMTMPRPKAWGRVLRRYYTAARRMIDPALLDVAFDHLRSDPESARHIFDYLSVFELTVSRHHELLDALEYLGGVYEDIELLAHEYVVTAPNDDSNLLRETIGQWASDLVEHHAENWPRLACAALISLGKFGTEEHFMAMNSLLNTKLRADTVARQQAIVVLESGGLLREEHYLSTPHTTVETSQHVRFLRGLRIGDSKATNMALSLVTPIKRTMPDRYVIRPRALFLANLVTVGSNQKAMNAVPGFLTKLESNAEPLRDRAAERCLRRSMPIAPAEPPEPDGAEGFPANGETQLAL